MAEETDPEDIEIEGGDPTDTPAEELEPGAEGDPEVSEAAQAKEDEEGEQGAAADEHGDEELVVTIGDEQPAAQRTPAPQWARDLRKKERESARRIRDLEAQLQQAGVTPAAKGGTLGPRPTMEAHNFDTAEYDKAVDAWHERKKEIERAEREAEASKTEDQKQWDQRLGSHKERAGKLKVSNYQDAEETVFAALDQTQQGCLIQVSDRSELIVVALDRNPAKLQSLAAIKDPARFIYEIAKLETQLKTTTRRPATAPETRVTRGTAGKPTTVQAGLEKLRAEAAKTGDYSKVHAYKREARSKQAAK